MSCLNERHSAARGFLSAQACRPPRRPASRSGATSFSLISLAAAFVGVAGLILTSRVAAGEPNLYPTLPFESMAACAVGGDSAEPAGAARR